MTISLGDIKIDFVDGKFYRLTISLVRSDILDELEAEGETLSEALVNLHEQVEALNR